MHNLAFFEDEIFQSNLYGNPLILPDKDNVMMWLHKIYCELSPETLSCDGQASLEYMLNRKKQLLSALLHCEQILGRMTTEEEFFICP